MTKNIASVTVALVSAGSLLTGCNFEQPDAGCIVQDASFANWVAKYELQEGQDIPTSCQTKLTIGSGASFGVGGEQLGVFKFTDPDKAGSAILTLRPAGLYSRAALDPCDPATRQTLASNPDHPEWAALLETECAVPEGVSEYNQTAVGSLADEPDAQSFCSTSNWKAGQVKPRPTGQVQPDVAPTTTVTYLYDNVKVYAAPSAPGTQLTAELTYTRDECSAKFNVSAIWPAAPCNPDSSRESERCGAGSGINPNFAVVCDTSFRISNATDEETGEFLYPGTCVAQNAIPSFK